MPRIKFYSTNRKAPLVSFKEALLKGQAPDKGLYLPNHIPKLSLEDIASMAKMPYYEIAFNILKNFIVIPEEELMKISKDAYNFGIPLEQVYNRNYLMRLDQGPTCSFKDFAARMMARLMQYYLKQENKNLTILTATSGDTGSAVANAFYNVKGINVVVSFPSKEVTDMQRKQMTTLSNNITALAVDGKFDDCQAMVKQAFSDAELQYLNLSSANSINIGRLLSQSVYYFYAYSRLAKNNEQIVFSVPSGNFGDLTAGLLAKKMGLAAKFIAATNENNEFPNFLKTGQYAPLKPSKTCISNAMNVGHPSNLARLISLYNGHMDEKGNMLEQPNMKLIKKDIFSVSISDEETRAAIKDAYEKHSIILEPHGAVGWAGLQNFLKSNNTNLCVSLETAHPAKFPEEIEKIIGLKPEYPPALKDLEKKEEHFERISADYKEFKKFLTDKIN